MFKFLIFVLFALSESGANPSTERIIGGNLAHEGQFPFLASLRLISNTTKIRRHFCGAAIISEYFLITAAHCVVNKTPGSMKAFVGSKDLLNGGTFHSIYKVIIHPTYKGQRHDIAILESTLPMQIGTNIKPINLPIALNINPGDKTVATGWGSGLIPFLQYLKGTFISNEECSKLMKGNIGPEYICFAPEPGHGACFGDSGSPLVYTIGSQSYVVGLASFVIGSHHPPGCSTRHPTVYCNVSHYVSWIQKVVKKNSLDLHSVLLERKRRKWIYKKLKFLWSLKKSKPSYKPDHW